MARELRVFLMPILSIKKKVRTVSIRPDGLSPLALINPEKSVQDVLQSSTLERSSNARRHTESFSVVAN